MASNINRGENRKAAAALAHQVVGDLMVAATEGDEAARDLVDFKAEILDGWTEAITALLDEKDREATIDPPGLASQPGLLVDESGHQVDLGLPVTASAEALGVDEMRPEYDFDGAVRGPVIVRQPPDPLGLAARVVVVVDMLRKCEWFHHEDDQGEYISCPVCEGGAASYGSKFFDYSQQAQHEADCPLAAALATPSPAAEAVRKVVAQVLVRRAMRVRGIHGTGRNTGPIDEAADYLATNFPALAAGLEKP